MLFPSLNLIYIAYTLASSLNRPGREVLRNTSDVTYINQMKIKNLLCYFFFVIRKNLLRHLMLFLISVAFLTLSVAFLTQMT